MNTQYLVAIFEDGEWNLTWGTILYKTAKEADIERLKATEAGYPATVCMVTPMMLR